MRVLADGMPDTVRHSIEQDIGEQPDWQFVPDGGLDAAHVFAVERAALEPRLEALRTMIGQAGFVWVSWPSEGSGIATDIDGEWLRAIVGWTAVGACAIDESWHGMKLVGRR